MSDLLDDLYGLYRPARVDMYYLWREAAAIGGDEYVAFEMRYTPDGMRKHAFKDIARACGVSTDTARSRVSRMLRKLRSPQHRLLFERH